MPEASTHGVVVPQVLVELSTFVDRFILPLFMELWWHIKEITLFVDG
jgi:hypothetical protein